MIFFLSAFVILLLVIGFWSGRGNPHFRCFVIADHDRSWPLILCSLLATMIGGSATFGIASTAYEIGAPALWWLGVGSIGLVLQGIFISGKIRDLQVQTLGEAAEVLVGKTAGKAVSIVIIFSWLGIIAGQFIALGKIASFLTEQADTPIFIIVAALVVIAYTAVGGQLGVMRTDTLFFFVLIAGVAVAFCTLTFGIPGELFAKTDFCLFHTSFTPADGLYLLFMVGGTYFIGPDVLSRSMTAKNATHAKTASVLGGVLLLVFNGMMVTIALWCRANIADLGGFDPLVYLMTFVLPPYATVLLAMGLTAALLSSASTCLITVAASIQRDLLGHRSVAETRFLIVLIGIVSLVTALGNSDIIAVLTAAYSVYAPGIVMPLCIALLCYSKRKISLGFWLAAVACGGICGILGNLLSLRALPLLGMAASALLTLLGSKKEISQF